MYSVKKVPKNFCKIHKETSVPESLCDKDAGPYFHVPLESLKNVTQTYNLVTIGEISIENIPKKLYR